MSESSELSKGQIPKPPDDIPAARLEVCKLKWSTPEETQASISALYQYTEGHASDAIAWYARNKGNKAVMSRFLRMGTILLTTLGGLTPLVTPLIGDTITIWEIKLNVGQLGYLFLALAAACVGLDRFFGFSSGWMRYISTMMSLERALAEFRLDWSMMVVKFGGKTPTLEQGKLAIQRLREFLVAVDSRVSEETEAWVSEFRANLSDLEKRAREQAEAARPGGIDITITNGAETEDGFTVLLDGMDPKRVRGSKYQIPYVLPGAHKVTVAGTIKGGQVEAHETANVTAGAIVNVSLTLAAKKA